MEKYLITGGAGFVGFHFISYLNSIVQEKTSVLCIDKIVPVDINSWIVDNLELKFEVCDMENETQLTELICNYKPDYILHLAALSSVGQSWSNPVACFKNNTNIFLNIVEAIRKNCCDTKLLCIGSSEEYGNIDENDIPISEDLPIYPENPYAVTKVAQEGLSKCYVDKFGMNITLTRSFNHIGPRQKETFVIASFAKQLAQAYVNGDKKCIMRTGNLGIIRDFLDVRDVVAAYYKILKLGKAGELYNVCSGEGYELNTVIDILSKIANIEIVKEINPDLIRTNDIPKVIGSNKKLIYDTGWKPIYKIEDSLYDIFEYWVKKISE